MQITEQNTISKTIEKLRAVSRGLPIQTHHAWLFSACTMSAEAEPSETGSINLFKE